MNQYTRHVSDANIQKQKQEEQNHKNANSKVKHFSGPKLGCFNDMEEQVHFQSFQTQCYTSFV
jgi:hypothetical protein